MGQILTIASSKGGSGKSTLATLLAICLGSLRRGDVALIDTDPNGSVSDWHGANYEGPPIRCLYEPGPLKIVQAAYEAAESADVLIDTAGFGNTTAAHAIGCADAVLIPCMADRASVREAMRTNDLVRRVNARMIPCKIVFSDWSVRGIAESATVADIEAAGLEPLTTYLPAMAAFRQLTFTGNLPAGRAYEIGLQLVEELISLRILNRSPRKKGK